MTCSADTTHQRQHVASHELISVSGAQYVSSLQSTAVACVKRLLAMLFCNERLVLLLGGICVWVRLAQVLLAHWGSVGPLFFPDSGLPAIECRRQF